MSNTSLLLSHIVAVDAGFKPAVHLPDDFAKPEQNEQLIRTYIPTTQSISFLAEVARSMNPVSNERARMLTGTFGTGKSDLLLMLCNYFSRPVDDPIMHPFYEKLQRINESQYTTIYQQRANKKPFLVVLLQADAVTPFPGFILHGLEVALKQAGLDDLMLPTRYAAAREKIEEWQREDHPVLQQFVAALRDNEGQEVSTLLKFLSESSADLAFPAFLRAFRSATGTAFDIYSFNRPEETYKRVAQALRERGNHSGILVVCDEFTAILRRLARASDQQASEVESEALGVQDLANTSVASLQNQLHFVISSLDNFAGSSAESTSQTGSKAVEKIGGRFKEFELALQDSAELIRGAIRRLDETVVLPNRQRDELMELTRALWPQQTKQWVTDMVIDGCFPLHPLVTYSLPLINRQVAQNNRTMFQFLKDNDGLGGFLQQPLASVHADWSNLLTLDQLFDYFEKSIQVRRSDITDAYNHALQLLERSSIDTTLACRVLKVVAFCEVIAPQLSPTRQLIRHALNLPPAVDAELVIALTMLAEQEALYPPNDSENEATGVYSLPMSGRVSSVNLRQRVIRKARESHTNVARLQEAYPADTIMAEDYNRRRGSARALKAKYISVTEISSGARLKDDLAAARSGLLWYVIASSENERSDAQSRARELTRQHPRLVVAVPIVPLSVLDTLKNYEALKTIRSDETLDSNARSYLSDNGLVGKSFREPLMAAAVKLGEEKQWEWFREGASQPNITNRAQAQDLASKVMTTVFPYTPEHSFTQHFKVEGYTTNLNAALKTVLSNDLRISKSGKREEEVIRNGMAGLGLAKLTRTEGAYEIFTLEPPTGGQYNSQKIWQLFSSYLSNKKSWLKLIETLRSEPYGLYDSLLIIFAAAFLTFHADSIEISTVGGQPSVLDEKTLKELIDKPQNYTVRLQPLSEPEKHWLRGVVTTGLRKPFDPGGGHGKTLRSRVAAQVKTWLSGRSLPLFAEKLDVGQLSSLLPDTAQPVITAAVILLRTPRNEESIASALLKEIPAALHAPDHPEWTEAQVAELLGAWAETCRLIEDVPRALEQHAAGALAAVFGSQDQPAEYQWESVYLWRMSRRIVENRVDKLTSNTRVFFRLAGQSSGSLRTALLDEFAQQINGIHTEYRMWPMLNHLERLVKEVQKARDEVEDHWRTVASAEDVWHDSVASAALGRPVSGVNAGKVARYLHEWATSITWPSATAAIQPAELEQFYPPLEPHTYHDISVILQRTQHGADDWQRELADSLPKQFGIEGWTKAEVERATARLSAALKHAANLDALLRKQIVSSVLALFASEADPGETLRHWHDAHAIPPENDLDENAQIVLRQIASNSDVETTLLITLPRALSGIGQSYQQWQSYAKLEQYMAIVQQAVQAINNYMPLTAVEQRWLLGVAAQVLGRPLANAPREKNQLATLVGTQFATWLDDQQLPGFAANLTAQEISDLFPATSPSDTLALSQVLQLGKRFDTDPTHTLLNELPTVLEASEASTLDQDRIEAMLATLSRVCALIHGLNDAITQRLFADVGSIFGVEAHGNGAGSLVAKLREWRQAYVLFANEPLSANAALVSQALATPTDDPSKLLLTTLPAKLNEMKVPYGNWHSWDQRIEYLQSLEAAANEIARRGHVSDATPEVYKLWQSWKTQIDGLSRDEQRWLIKAFSEEFSA